MKAKMLVWVNLIYLNNKYVRKELYLLSIYSDENVIESSVILFETSQIYLILGPNIFPIYFFLINYYSLILNFCQNSTLCNKFTVRAVITRENNRLYSRVAYRTLFMTQLWSLCWLGKVGVGWVYTFLNMPRCWQWRE